MGKSIRKFEKICVSVGILLFVLSGCSRQKEFVYTTSVIFPSSASLDEKVKMAAHVVPSSRQLEWQKMEQTCFICYGINTFTDREWGTGDEDLSLFNPTALDAGQWVWTAKQAGMKMVLLTCKHHDGFCLWPSAYTDFSVKSTPWKDGKGDLVRDVADACKKEGMKFAVYLSPWDMNHPDYGTDAYNDYFVNQLTELLTQYGSVDEVWFDGACGEGLNGKKQVYDFETWNVRLVGKAKEKFDKAPLDDKAPIILTEWAARSVYNKEKKQSYPYLVIFDYDMNDKNGQ